MNENHLHILWTNDNPVTAEHMVILYSINAIINKWWDKVTVIIWGATSQLVAENRRVRELIEEAQQSEVEFSACLACAENLGTVEQIEELGIELKYWGEPLTDLVKNGAPVLTI